MELYAGVISPNSKRVRICAAELGSVFDVKIVDFQKGDHRSSEYLALNPMGKVPTLVNGELVLWESCAILFYLARTSGGVLWPESPRAQADVLRWMFFGASHLDPYFTTLVVERFMKPMRGEPPDPAQCAAAEQSLARFLPIVDHQLAGAEYLADPFGLADIALACTVELLPMLGHDLAKYANIQAWIARLQARDSWRQASAGAVKPAGASTRERFVDAYDGGVAPAWDIGEPQRDLVKAFDELALSGSAIDLGCGTGDHVLELARRGLDAWGLDSTPAAIALAERKGAARGLPATFVAADALDLAPLGRTFDTVLDCGLFHVLEDPERRAYVREIARVLRPGGRHLMLGFTSNSTGRGPRGYAPEQLRDLFNDGFREEFIRPAVFQETGSLVEQTAWLSLFTRAG
jgi:glutathione S-transferase/SAM-dependent methyltransferase